jgi:hypothetical protein
MPVLDCCLKDAPQAPGLAVGGGGRRKVYSSKVRRMKTYAWRNRTLIAQ